MKNMVKKNQIMITALALMIAVAGYLNFAGGKVSDEEIVATASETVEAENVESLDSELVIEDENYLDQSMEEIMTEEIMGTSDEDTQTVMEEGKEVPGEAVFTSAPAMNNLSGAKLMKEQVRSKNKEILLEIINNTNISEEQKQEAIDGMIAITDVAEKETAAEILLGAKGFEDVVVSITEDMVDVVVDTTELTEAQRAQIEDIVIRKTGVTPDQIIISTTTEQ